MDLTLLQIGLVLLGLGLSAYFSAVEISLLSANRFRLQQEARQHTAGAHLALELLRNQEQVLTTTLVGINLSNLAIASIATLLLDRWLGPGWVTTLVSTVGITTLILVLGEIVPKVWAKRVADRFLLVMARPIWATEQLLLPLTAGLRFYLGFLLRAFRRRTRHPFVTREELKGLVHEVPGESGPGRKEKQMLRSILDFGETTAREVMVPMPEVISIERDSSVDLVRTLAKRHGYTRLPIYQRRVDRVVGILNVFDVLYDSEPGETVAGYLRPAVLSPESKRIDRLLLELQRDRQTMAVVVSEFGSCVGILTVEDILEEIVGEISEEHEIGVRKIRQVAPRTYVVNALTDLDDINEELGLSLPKGRYDTLAGLVLKHFGRIPHEGEGFEQDGTRLEVVDVHPYGVRSIKLVLAERSSPIENWDR